MTQCPLSKFACCCFSPKIIFLAISFLGIGLSVLSIFWPKRSIALYQWIMKQFNWQVAPIDEPREVRNTVILGAALGILSSVMFVVAQSKF